jgi:biotin-dependent carboxylase-like uncharacterized protein
MKFGATARIEILHPGPLATVQDLGRPGLEELGVGRSGAADRGAHRLANRLVGNHESAATVEITLGGLSLRLLSAATVAFTGARCPLSGIVTGAWNCALSCPAGSLISVGAPLAGLRSYLAVRGGIAVTPVLGSRATDMLSRLGPPALQAGDRLPIGELAVTQPGDEAPPLGPGSPAARLATGPRADWFEPEDIQQRLFGSSWLVGADSNRIGLRLHGPALRRRSATAGSAGAAAELPSEPTLPGAIQVPPDGQPIVLGPDAPVTGGYPVIAVVMQADQDLLAQLGPGAELRFEATQTSVSGWPD